MKDKTPREKSIELDGYDMEGLLSPTPILDSIIKRDLENDKLKNLGEGEAGTGYALLSDVLALTFEDLQRIAKDNISKSVLSNFNDGYYSGYISGMQKIIKMLQ